MRLCVHNTLAKLLFSTSLRLELEREFVYVSFYLSVLEALPLLSCICTGALNFWVAENELLEDNEFAFKSCTFWLHGHYKILIILFVIVLRLGENCS